jgi:hypothetical protein
MSVEQIMEIPAKLNAVGITDTSVMICLAIALAIGFAFCAIKRIAIF